LNHLSEEYPQYFPENFNPDEWVEAGNIVLQKDGDFALFEYEEEGIYFGHFFFTQSRGAEAKELAQEMLSSMFTKMNTKIIKGMTPLENRPARWMARQIGFASLGSIMTENGECELFYLTKDDWENKNGIS
jgi:hypothetical protein